MTRPYVIWPLRFAVNPAALIAFYVRLGLRLSFTHDRGGFASLVGRAGAVGVQDASYPALGTVRGHTALNLATTDLLAATEELAAAGHPVKVWEVRNRRQGVVASWDGRVVGLNETSRNDLYGGCPGRDADGGRAWTWSPSA